MKEITTSKGAFIFEMVVVSESFQVVKNKLSSEFFFRFPNLYITDDYQFLCTTDTITEDVSESIIGNLYNYFDTILESFYAFLLYNNLDTNKIYAICKKK